MRVLLLAMGLLMHAAVAQNSPRRPARLSEDRFKSGALTLRAFMPVAEVARDSVVKINLNGKTVALGTVIDASGLVITKASEIKEGKLRCRLRNGTEVDAERLATDEENDLALVKVEAAGLKPIEWASEEPSIGQWAVTPGIERTPEAVGIISVPQRKILHKRALIGVLLEYETSTARIREVMAGLGAEKAGLKPGDVILAVNDTRVKNSEELTRTLRNYRDGQTVKLRAQREKEEFDASVDMMVPKSGQMPRALSREERLNHLAGEVSQRAEGFTLALQHDTVLQPWQCGGPLVNLDGKAIGLNIARAGRVASYALPGAFVKQLIESLKAQAQLPVKHQETRHASHQLQPVPRK